jgi:hypothetical protein
MTLEDYIRRVDEAIEAETHGEVGVDDIPDYDYAEAWEDHVPPRSCARRAIRAAWSW